MTGLLLLAGLVVAAVVSAVLHRRESARAAVEPRPRDPISTRFAEGAPVDACGDTASTGGTRIVQKLPHHLKPGDVLALDRAEVHGFPGLQVLDGKSWVLVYVHESRGRHRRHVRWFDPSRYVDVEGVVA